MRLTVFNGSPRGAASNTSVLLASFMEGFVSLPGNTCETVLLVHRKQNDEFVRLFREAEHILLAFPLYFDAMPSSVKEFIESLEPLCGRPGNPTLGCIVQSGFPEALHSQPVAAYLEKLALRLGCPYKGTVIKGGAEGIRVPPLQENWLQKGIVAVGKATNLGRVGHLFDTKKMCRRFFELGRIYAQSGEFDQELVKKLAQPEKLNRFGLWVVQASIHGLYWNPVLKKNGAYPLRFARPFERPPDDH
jgi:multimeric flavodoxin WrbA